MAMMQPIAGLMSRSNCCPPGLYSDECNTLQRMQQADPHTNHAEYWRPCGSTAPQTAACAQAWIPWWKECGELMLGSGLITKAGDAQHSARIRREAKEFEAKCRRTQSEH